MPSLRDAALAISALGQNAGANPRNLQTVCEAVQELSYRLQALEAVVGATARRAGVTLQDAQREGTAAAVPGAPRDEAIAGFIRSLIR